jgi:hypothetical protein
MYSAKVACAGMRDIYKTNGLTVNRQTERLFFSFLFSQWTYQLSRAVKKACLPTFAQVLDSAIA